MTYHAQPRSRPGSADPVLFTCVTSALGVLVVDAYDLQFYQRIAPGWMKMGGSVNGYDLNAKVPAGATQEKLRLMIQKLLSGAVSSRFTEKRGMATGAHLSLEMPTQS